MKIHIFMILLIYYNLDLLSRGHPRQVRFQFQQIAKVLDRIKPYKNKE